MKALLAEFGDVDSGGTEGWTYNEDDEKAGSSTTDAGGKAKDGKEEKRKADAAALLSQFIPPEGKEGCTEEDGGVGSKGVDK